MFTPTLFTPPSPECKAMPRSPYGHMVNPASVSWRMPRKKYSDGKSSPPVKVSAPGFGSFWANAVPAAPAHVATVNRPTIATRTRNPALVVTRTSTPPGGFATCGIADVAPPGARGTPPWAIPRFSAQNAAIDADGVVPGPTKILHFCVLSRSIKHSCCPCPLTRHGCRPEPFERGGRPGRAIRHLCHPKIGSRHLCRSVRGGAGEKSREIACFCAPPGPGAGERLAPGLRGRRAQRGVPSLEGKRR